MEAHQAKKSADKEGTKRAYEHKAVLIDVRSSWACGGGHAGCMMHRCGNGN